VASLKLAAKSILITMIAYSIGIRSNKTAVVLQYNKAWHASFPLRCWSGTLL